MSRKHVLFVGFPLYGSLIPFLELAKKISKFHDVTFAVSQGRIKELQSRGFQLVGEAENTTVPHIMLYSLDDEWAFSDMGIGAPAVQTAPGDVGPAPPKVNWEKMNGVQGAAAKLMRGISTRTSPGSGEIELMPTVDVVIVDFFMLKGTIPTCKEREIPFYVFSSSNALVPLQAVLVDEDTPTRPGNHFEAAMRGDFDETPNEKGEFEPPLMKERVDSLLLPMRRAFIASHGIIMNSVREFEKESIDWMERSPIIKEGHLFCVAPLMPDEEEGNDDDKAKVQSWLDGKSPGSIVYISFGSLVTPRPEQLMELGKAIQKLGRPYIWSLKPSHYANIPKGIQKDTENWLGQGLVLSWAPQKLILAHATVGVFISHSGLNSTVESLSAGKPMVCCPVAFDHLVTAHTAVQHGVGKLIGPKGFHRDAKLISAEDIVAAVGEAQAECTQKANEWRLKLTHAWEVSGATTKEFNQLVASISNA